MAVTRLVPLAVAAAALVAAAGAPSIAQEAEDDGIERSLVQIVVYAQRGDWYSPWELKPVETRSGSGFVIEGGRVMTNAHVVSDARLVLLSLHGDPTAYPGRVAFVAHDSDLALVVPEDPTVLADVPPLSLGPTPRLRSTVETFGYPAGGAELSVTRGVVSRIDDQVYAHSGIDSHMTVQTDAAINPGNSGGPVMQDGRVVGVAFQASFDLENVGYMIPPEVIERFLRDVSDGRYDGYPDLGIRVSGLENPAARRRAGLADGESGVRVEAIDPRGSSDGPLRPGDIVLAIDDRTVANDGTVADGEQRIRMGLLADRRQAGESVRLRVLREGERIDVTVPLRIYPPHRRMANSYDVRPRYYVYGGLVFVPLDRELLETFGEAWFTKGDKLLLDALYQEPLRRPELWLRERVVLLRKLDHPVNGNMAWHRNSIVERVNGRTIDSLEDLIEAVESNRDEFQVFELAHLRRLSVLDRRAADAANAEILERYGITVDRHL